MAGVLVEVQRLYADHHARSHVDGGRFRAARAVAAGPQRGTRIRRAGHRAVHRALPGFFHPEFSGPPRHDGRCLHPLGTGDVCRTPAGRHHRLLLSCTIGERDRHRHAHGVVRLGAAASLANQLGEDSTRVLVSLSQPAARTVVPLLSCSVAGLVRLPSSPHRLLSRQSRVPSLQLAGDTESLAHRARSAAEAVACLRIPQSVPAGRRHDRGDESRSRQ